MRSATLAALIAAFLLPVATAQVVINELRVDQTGVDNDEYFELFGPAGTSLDGYTFVVIGDGSTASGTGSGTIEWVFPLDGITIPADGFLLVGGGDDNDGIVFGVTADVAANPNFENSDNITYLLVQGFTGTDGQDLDTNDDGTLDVTPWTSIVDGVSLVETTAVPPAAGDEYTYGPSLGLASVGPDGNFMPGHVYRPSNAPTTWAIGPFDPTTGVDTPGAINPVFVAGEGAPTAALSLRLANPATAGATVAIAAPAEATLTLVDALGRTVATLATGTARTATLPAVAPGVYVLRLESAGQSAARVISVVR